MPLYSLLLKAIVRAFLPDATGNLDEYLKEHPLVAKKIENIFYIILYTILFINIFICLPYTIFTEYAINYCSWDISEFNFYNEIGIIILSIFLVIELIICKINFKLLRGEKINEIVKIVYAKLFPLLNFMGKMSLLFVFLSIMFYFMLIYALWPIDKKYVMNCSANISKAPEILYDTKETKIIRKQQTKKYTYDIAAYYWNNWNPPVTGLKKFQSVHVLVRISKDGKLLKCEIDESSNIDEFDNSALEVVKSADIYKPLPESLKAEYVDFMFGFSVEHQGKYVGEYQNLCKNCQNPYKDDYKFY